MLMNNISLELKTSQNKNQTIEAIDSGKALIQNQFETITSHLLFLEKSRPLTKYINNRTEQSRQMVETMFANLQRSNMLYDQIRLLDENGQEIVRVDYVKKNTDDKTIVSDVKIIPSSQLQNKKDRYYFQTTAKLAQGAVYISPLDLNKEKGVVEIPYKPLIRFATPIYDKQSNFKGVLTLNCFGQYFINEFKKQFKMVAGDVSFLNGDGYWILSEHSDNEWGFMLPHHKNFKDNMQLCGKKLKRRKAAL